MRGWGHRLVALAGAVAGGLTGWWLGTPVIAFGLVQVFAIAAWLFVRYRTWIPERTDWQSRRWNGLLTIVIVAGVMVAGNNMIEKTLKEGIALSLLVFSVGYTSFLLGVVVTRESLGEVSDATSKTKPAD